MTKRIKKTETSKLKNLDKSLDRKKEKKERKRERKKTIKKKTTIQKKKKNQIRTHLSPSRHNNRSHIFAEQTRIHLSISEPLTVVLGLSNTTKKFKKKKLYSPALKTYYSVSECVLD